MTSATSLPEIETKLRRSVAALESAALESAVEIGTETYGSALLDHLSEFQKAWAAARPRHHEICDEIVEVDPALVPPTDQLNEAHATITADLVDLMSETLSLLSQGEGPARLTEIQSLRARVLSRVAQCRSYERSLGDWLLEAHFRDRGRGAS